MHLIAISLFRVAFSRPSENRSRPATLIIVLHVVFSGEWPLIFCVYYHRRDPLASSGRQLDAKCVKCVHTPCHNWEVKIFVQHLLEHNSRGCVPERRGRSTGLYRGRSRVDLLATWTIHGGRLRGGSERVQSKHARTNTNVFVWTRRLSISQSSTDSPTYVYRCLSHICWLRNISAVW